jgi:host factor-I protein
MNDKEKVRTMAKSTTQAAMPGNMQDAFLAHLVKGHAPVTVFLTNGVKLSGSLSFADEHCMTLTRDGVTQLIFKHAVATVMPQDAFSIYDLLGDTH